MAEILPSVVVKEILSKLLSFASEEVSLARHFKAEHKRLAERLKLIQALLSDAEGKQTTATVRLWLKNLETVAYDADDLLDEFAYEILRLQVQNRKRDRVRDLLSLSKLSFRLEMAHKIKEINDSLDEFYKEADRIGLKPVDMINATVEHNEIRVTHPSVDDLEIVGRDDDISKLVHMLTCSGNDDYLSVVAIVGMGGQGKTTLAQLVYKHDRVVKHFDKTMWVCVFDDFEVIRLLNEMVQSLTGSNPQLSNIEGIRRNYLDDLLKQKKYLLVLDDVWNEDWVKWDRLRSALIGIGGSTGSKVIVTTRNEKVVRVMKTSLTHSLEKLSDEDGWTMFKLRAFADGGAIEADNFVSIGKEIVKNCQGLPLAIRIAGDLMWSKKSENKWREILDSLKNIRDEVLPIRDEVLPILKLSYNNLKSSSLKQCYRSCSIFPKDSDIGKENLIQIWMALGLLQPHSGSGSVVEVIGSNYFNTLLVNSLLQDAKEDEYENIISCKMHDLVHDLASKNFCLTSEAEVNYDSEIVHLSLVSASGEVPKILSRKLPRLRTLYLKGGLNGESLTNFKCVRVLILINNNISELPGSIGELKHLRYLDISETRIHTLPDDVTKLYNLQTLRVSYLKELLPKKFGNLINLRHFYVEGIRGSQIGLLQDLDQFTGELNIYGLKDVKKEEAEHAKLSNKLQIHALGFHWAERYSRIGSRNEEEALNDAHVLERLKPHSNLKGLRIGDSMGGSFPPWMMMETQSLLYNLVKIELRRCRRCEEIPALGHLPYLKVVEIEEMDNVKCIGPEFYGKQMVGGGASTSSGAITTSFKALRELSLKYMRKLEEWSEAEHPSLVFPCLEVLNIDNCKGLRKIPSQSSLYNLVKIELKDCRRCEEIPALGHLPYLKVVYIRRMDNVKCIGPEFYGKKMVGGGASTSSGAITTSFPALRELTLKEMSKLEEWSEAEHPSLVFPCLEVLKIEWCKGLRTIPSHFPSVKELSIWQINSLALGKMSSKMMTSLTSLHLSSVDGSEVQIIVDELLGNNRLLRNLSIMYCDELLYLRTSLQALMALESLVVRSCPKLMSVSELCTSLEELTIVDCPGLVSLPDFQCLRKLELRGSFSQEVDYFPWISNPTSSYVQHLQELKLFELTSLPEQFQHLSALTSLQLWSCDGLVALPEWLAKLSSLQHLHIKYCKNLMSMPTAEAMQRLVKLRQLEITSCPLLVERWTEGTRPEWNKIAHIPEIRINYRRYR